MKKITQRTKIVQEGNIYRSIEVDGIIYWYSGDEILKDEPYLAWETNYATRPKERWVIYYKSNGLNGENQRKIIAQSGTVLEGVPVISLEINNKKLIMEGECPLDLNSYSLEDIKMCIKLSREIEEVELNVNEIIEQLNSVREIEVDDEFNIIRFL